MITTVLQSLKLAALATCQRCPVNGDSSSLAVLYHMRDGGTWYRTEGVLSTLQNNRVRVMAGWWMEKLQVGMG